MKTFTGTFLILLASFFINFSCLADNWSENKDKIIYSPRYFGPNAFPIPTMRNGLTYDRWEVEGRFEYYHYSGDKTRDWFLRLVVPFVRGRAALEVTYVINERYRTTEEVMVERHAAGTTTRSKNQGDIVVSAIFQVLKKKELLDILFSATIKTASGDQVAYARYTDAASYWFDVNIGRDIYRDDSNNASIRLQAQGGFYCWMTNLVYLRQNDAPSFGGGVTATYKRFTFSSECAGFSGYKKNGDKPLVIRNRFQYEYKKNIVSLRYHHGMRDNLYDCYSIGLIRCF
ncbi:MAG: hypothetical protein LUG98_13390 [Tannerellaceae bacterium]|nr:hypothetical protein [Tannerellaceae bacterium]